ncbi:hypothetical protein [Gaopeijia maritima]|uniref:Uncharacterized protein n=1 Tax=Gaopeijia maritima TaxID=3119007 RepID=A0ABU9EDJ3_9BACT
MSRLKPLLFVIGLSLVSAVTLRWLLGRVSAGMSPPAGVPTVVDSTEVDRRMVGCGQFRFVFDSLGYRSGQWPAEVDEPLAVERVEALFVARHGQVEALVPGGGRRSVGEYLIRRDTAYLTLGAVPGGLRARLGPVGDSLGGRLERSSEEGAGDVVGRLFLSTPVPLPLACGSG